MLELALDLHKICSKLTMKAPERHQLTSLRCCYCKLYTHFHDLSSFGIVDPEHERDK